MSVDELADRAFGPPADRLGDYLANDLRPLHRLKRNVRPVHRVKRLFGLSAKR